MSLTLILSSSKHSPSNYSLTMHVALLWKLCWFSKVSAFLKYMTGYLSPNMGFVMGPHVKHQSACGAGEWTHLLLTNRLILNQTMLLGPSTTSNSCILIPLSNEILATYNWKCALEQGVNEGKGLTLWVHQLPTAAYHQYTRKCCHSRSQPFQQSPKMDVFSFGVLFVETCSCKELILLNIDPRMVKLIQECTTKERDKRPSVAKIMACLS